MASSGSARLHTAVNPNITLPLFCWVYGDDAQSIFSIDVSNTTTVSDLKKAIKDKDPMFRDIDASELILYSTPASDDDDELERHLNSWTSDGKQPLGEQRLLSKVDPSDSLIVIDAPNLGEIQPSTAVPDMTFNCWIRGSDANRIFQVKISSTEIVDDLKVAIKKEKKVDFSDIDTNSLNLYKVSIPSGDCRNEVLHNLSVDKDQPLAPLLKLADISADLNKKNLHIVVEAPSARSRANPKTVDPPPFRTVASQRRIWLDNNPPRFPPQPYPTQFTSLLRGTRVDFQYTCQPFEEKLLFYGTIPTESRNICIKFVRRYSKEVHDLCASRGCAPALLGFETMPAEAGWFMVVMDKLDPDEYSGILNMRGYVQSPTGHQVQKIRETLRNLHREGWVHGDVRDANIMLSETDPERFMFIDFDWAGKIGQVRYPASVNKGPELWRPERVDGEKLILAEDDEAMLKEVEDRVRMYA